MVEFVFAVEISRWVKHTNEATTRGSWPLSLFFLNSVGWRFFFLFFYFFIISSVTGFGGLRNEIFSLG